MKNLLRLLAALCLVIALGLTAYAVHVRYEGIRTKQAATAEAEALKQRQAATEARSIQQAALDSLMVKYNTLHGECLKGVEAYNGHTLANKKKFTAPACGDTL